METITISKKKKYHFADMEVGTIKKYEDSTTASLLNSANQYCRLRGLDWVFKTWSEDSLTVIIRTK